MKEIILLFDKLAAHKIKLTALNYKCTYITSSNKISIFGANIATIRKLLIHLKISRFVK